jgi:hypothetical protein
MESDDFMCPHRNIATWEPLLVVLSVNLFLPLAVHAAALDEEFSSYFSSTYEQARGKFVQSAQVAGMRIESYRHPLTGPDGEAIYTDVAHIGPDAATTVLVLSSGTHGVEGFAGSAIQVGLLREGISERLPPGLRLMMIHAINPYGFAHLRRVNEDNVDVNRNFVDHTKPHPKNLGYELLADEVAPESLSFLGSTRDLLSLSWYMIKKGVFELRKAISQGQYSHQEGLFYGGNAATWSSVTVETIVHKYLSSAKKVMVVDYHTGLGDFAAAELIMNVPTESYAYKYAKDCWGEVVRSTKEGSVSIDIRGSLKLAIPKMLPQANVTAVSLEFGTFPARKVFWTMRAENWLHHHADEGHSEWKRIKSNLLQVFYPRDNTWEQAVWEKGKRVSEKALICLGH